MERSHPGIHDRIGHGAVADSGAFWKRHAELRERTEMDYAYRLLISHEGGEA